MQLVGTYDAPTTHIGPPHSLFYKPFPLHDGLDSFNFALSNCPNHFLLVSRPYTYTLSITHINHAPVALPFLPVTAHQSTAVVVTLNGTSVDHPLAALTWVLRQPPTRGILLSNGVALGLGSTFPYYAVVQYRALLPLGNAVPPCGSAFQDTFGVQLTDGADSDSVKMVSVVRLTCDSCPAPYMLNVDLVCLVTSLSFRFSRYTDMLRVVVLLSKRNSGACPGVHVNAWLYEGRGVRILSLFHL